METVARQLKRISDRFLLSAGKKFAKEYHKTIKDFVIQRVESHPVSVELRQHTNPSSFVPGLGSKGGTLFGFMGFLEGSDPVSDLINFLNKKITREETMLTSFYRTNIYLPDLSDMAQEKSLQLPWIKGASWPELLQSGVSGLRSFLAFDQGEAPPQSLSQEGLQAKTRDGKLIRIRSADMPPIPYLDEIFAEAVKIKI